MRAAVTCLALALLGTAHADPAINGTPTDLVWANANADPPSQNVTVPASSSSCHMPYSLYTGAGDGLASATLNGVAAGVNVAEAPGGGSNATIGIATWFAPTAGTVALDPAWDVAPVQGPGSGFFCVTGGDTAALRDSDYDYQLAATAVGVILTTVAGDLVCKYDMHYSAGSDTAPSTSSGWTSLDFNVQFNEGWRMSCKAATTTSTAADSEDENYSGVVAIAIGAPAAAGSAGALSGPMGGPLR